MDYKHQGAINIKFIGIDISNLLFREPTEQLKSVISEYYKFNKIKDKTFNVLYARADENNYTENMYAVSDNYIFQICACEPGSIYQRDDRGFVIKTTPLPSEYGRILKEFQKQK